jgi:hypothetical protein
MASYRWKPFVGLILLLAVFLQGVTPFLHAHTGISTLTGIHAPDASAQDHAVKQTPGFEQATRANEESFAVTVEPGISDEDNNLTLSSIALASIFLGEVTKITAKLYKSILLEFSQRLVYSFYSSESYPPPALAPPARIL